MKKELYIDDHLSLAYPDARFIPELFTAIDKQRVYLGKWLTWVDDMQELRDVRNVMMENIRMNEEGRKLITYIIYKEQLVGSVSLVQIDTKNRVGEIGYWLSEDLQGKGLMTKAVARLIDYVFRTMEIERLEIRVISKNKRSGNIPLRLGFEKEGSLRSAVFFKKKHYDFDIYGLLRKEWHNAR